MTVAQPITDNVVQVAITRSVQAVCRALLRKDAQFVGRMEMGAAMAPNQVMGNVGFVGDINGLVYLCMSEEFATFAVAEILGLSVAQVEFEGPEVLKDAIGEVTNMTVGGFKNALCDIGFPCRLTLPTIVRGQNLKAAVIKGATRHLFQFECAGRTLLADIQLKVD